MLLNAELKAVCQPYSMIRLITFQTIYGGSSYVIWD